MVEHVCVVMFIMLFVGLVIGIWCLVKIYGVNELVEKTEHEVRIVLPAEIKSYVADYMDLDLRRSASTDAKLEAVIDMLQEGEYDLELEMEEEACDCGCSPEDCELCESFVCEELDIHLISKEQWTFDVFDTGHYELKYYPNSDRVVYMNHTLNDAGNAIVEEVEIENVAECIGDGLKFFGVRSGDENTVYVRNNRFKSDFEIKKVVS